jgi:hypothetical protein
MYSQNRQNAAYSTGPKTPEGKAASSQNRLSHGLCSSALLLKGESEADFDQLRHELHQAYKPATAEEQILTDQLVEATWRLNRARRVEVQMQRNLMSDAALALRGHEETAETRPELLLSFALLNEESEGPLRRMHRYVTTIERSHQRAVKALVEAIKRRPVVVVAPKAKAVAATEPLPEIGFESPFVPTVPNPAPRFHNRP